jgi:hypothetical protein
MADVRLYEAVVVDGNPDPDLPGYIRVRVPELFGNDEVPVLIPPLYTGASFGGWHSVPRALDPDTEDELRCIVMHLGNLSFRWIGTSQPFPTVLERPTTAVGARSPDGRHSVIMDSELGVYLTAGSDNVEDEFSYISIDPREDVVSISTSTGSVAQFTENLVHIQNFDGDVLQLDATNGVTLMHSNGIASLNLKSGDVAALSGSVVQVNGGSIELGGGVVPPLNPYMLSLSFLADMQLLMTDIIAIGAAIPSGLPYVPTNAISISGKIATSITVGPPYLSTRVYGD